MMMQRLDEKLDEFRKELKEGQDIRWLMIIIQFF